MPQKNFTIKNKGADKQDQAPIWGKKMAGQKKVKI
jgi:hypothetical protein